MLHGFGSRILEPVLRDVDQLFCRDVPCQHTDTAGPNTSHPVTDNIVFMLPLHIKFNIHCGSITTSWLNIGIIFNNSHFLHYSLQGLFWMVKTSKLLYIFCFTKKPGQGYHCPKIRVHWLRRNEIASWGDGNHCMLYFIIFFQMLKSLLAHNRLCKDYLEQFCLINVTVQKQFLSRFVLCCTHCWNSFIYCCQSIDICKHIFVILYHTIFMLFTKRDIYCFCNEGKANVLGK